jgi:hypothetical protein
MPRNTFWRYEQNLLSIGFRVIDFNQQRPAWYQEPNFMITMKTFCYLNLHHDLALSLEV